MNTIFKHCTSIVLWICKLNTFVCIIVAYVGWFFSENSK
jgi:hypothetical protein